MSVNSLEIRSFEIRDVDTERREVTGVAVPWGQLADLGAYREIIARGAVQDSDDARLWWRHDEPIGRITRAEDTDAGWEITARISETERGNEAYVLLRDEVISQFSIGFEPVEHTDEVADDGVLTRTRTRIRVREVSLVPLPAYEGALVTQVREAIQSPSEKEAEMADTVSRVDLDEVRTTVEDLDRRMASLSTVPEQTAPITQFRSMGEYVKAVARGDELALRAYEGATSGDTVIKDGWVGDIYRVMRERQRILSLFQHSATLPAEGMNVEYGRVEADTTQVGIQANEGDDLLYGKVTIGTATAPVRTIGGWSSLSRQAIERTSVPVLDLTFQALAAKYAKAIETITRATLTTAVAAADSIPGDLTTQDGVVEALIDLVEEFEDRELNLSGLLVAKDVFLGLLAVPSTDRILQVATAPTDKVGTVTVRSLEGNIAGVPVTLFPGAAAGTVFGYDTLAVKTLESPGAPFRLQDENIVNLTKDFSIYGYAASFVQWAEGLVNIGPAV